MVTKSKEVVPVAANAGMALSQETPDWAKNGTGRGSENVGVKDLVLPRLEIVQAQSPIKDTNPDAAEGMLYNSVTGDVIGMAAFIVPVFYRMEWLIWKDQDAGGGFFGAHSSAQEAERRKAEEVAKGEDPTLLEIVDTPVHYCLMLRDDMTTEQIVMSMPKSKAKVSRKWNAIIQIAGGDRFSRAYKVTTFKDKNKMNKTFQNLIVQPAGFPPEAVFREAERAYKAFSIDGVKADHASGGGGESFTDAGGDSTI